MVHGFNRSDQTTAGVGMPELGESGRRIHNAIRYGVVHETDYERAEIRASVQDGELITDWIPWLTLRAGADLSWWAPEVGEVVILLSPSGELSNAAALPAAFSNGLQPAIRSTVQRQRFLDGAVTEYDRLQHRYLINLAGADADGTGPGNGGDPDEEAEGETDEEETPAEPTPATIVFCTRDNRITMQDAGNGGLAFVRIESVGNIEIIAGGEVLIQSGGEVSETPRPPEIPEDIEMEIPPSTGASTFIHLNP